MHKYGFNHWCLCPVSDLAPGQLGIDDMKMLEQKAQQLAAEAEQDKPKPKEKILFVRSVVHFFTVEKSSCGEYHFLKIKLHYVFYVSSYMHVLKQE